MSGPEQSSSGDRPQASEAEVELEQEVLVIGRLEAGEVVGGNEFPGEVVGSPEFAGEAVGSPQFAATLSESARSESETGDGKEIATNPEQRVEEREEQEEQATPKGAEHRIPEPSECPPAPRKMRAASSSAIACSGSSSNLPRKRSADAAFFVPPDSEVFGSGSISQQQQQQQENQEGQEQEQEQEEFSQAWKKTKKTIEN